MTNNIPADKVVTKKAPTPPENGFMKRVLLAQKEIGAIKKDSINPHFKNKYFDINALLGEVKPVLNEHSLVLTQGLSFRQIGDSIRNTLITSISDAVSDRGITYECMLPDAPDAPKMGAVITYFRRYALQSLLALEAEDDDAASATPGYAPRKAQDTQASTNYDEPPVLSSDEPLSAKSFKI